MAFSFSGSGPFSFPGAGNFGSTGFDLASAGTSLAGAGGAASGLGGLAGGLGAALGGPVGWAGLAMQGIGALGGLFGGNAAAEKAQQQLEAQRQYQVGANIFGQMLPRHLDFINAKEEIGLSNSPAFRQSTARDARFDTFGSLAGKYGPALGRRMTGGMYG
jgi:hypothetical protein